MVSFLYNKMIFIDKGDGNMDLRIVLQLIIPGLSTGLGAIPIFFMKDFSKRVIDILLGAAAGIMLAATFFSLLQPAIEQGGGGMKGAVISSTGILVGCIVLDLIDKYAPHEHLISHKKEGSTSESLKKIWLFIIAIAIHNFPEGLATGVATLPENPSNGLSVAIAIALQNIPEGLSVALALKKENYGNMKSFFIALLTGLIEPLGAVIGYGLVSITASLLPFILAFASGAMLFVISDEIIPETHSNGYEREATYGLTVGFIIMMLLDNLI